MRIGVAGALGMERETLSPDPQGVHAPSPREATSLLCPAEAGGSAISEL